MTGTGALPRAGEGRISPALGVLLVLAGILANKWSLESRFTPDGTIDSWPALVLIGLFQVASLVSGFYLLWKRPLIQVRHVVLVVLTSLVTAAAAEIGVRTWLARFADEYHVRLYSWPSDFDEDELRWAPHHYLNYYPTPGYRKGPTSHNSLGYRDREFPVQKPEGVYRIVALGGSTTYTDRVADNEKTFTSQLERILHEEHGLDHVRVINAGVGGYSTWESLINLEFRVLDLSPDLVIVYHGTNDVHPRLVAPVTYRGDNSGRRKQWTEPRIAFLVEHSYLLRIASRKLRLDAFPFVGLGSYVDTDDYFGPAAIPGLTQVENDTWERLLSANPPSFFRRNLESMIAVARAHDVALLLASWAHCPDHDDYASTEAYQAAFVETNEITRQVASEKNVSFFDFADRMSREKEYWADGRHVNEQGALLKAELFAEYLTGHVPELATKSTLRR